MGISFSGAISPVVALPKGEHMDFIPGSYAQIKVYSMDYNKDIDKSLISTVSAGLGEIRFIRFEV